MDEAERLLGHGGDQDRLVLGHPVGGDRLGDLADAALEEDRQARGVVPARRARTGEARGEADDECRITRLGEADFRPCALLLRDQQLAIVRLYRIGAWLSCDAGACAARGGNRHPSPDALLSTVGV
jgi:hypothetical protein